RAALNFADAARRAGVAQIVYLGGLGHDRDLSAHLASRQEVGRLLRSSGVPTLELRASIVIGPGSASFETVRALVERVPLIVAPKALDTLAQPIAIDDLLRYLMAAISLEQPADGVYEIGGADRVSYADLMREYARQRGLRRPLFTTELVTPRISRRLVGALAPAHGPVAAEMVESLRNETVVDGRQAAESFGVDASGVSAAIKRALSREDLDFSERHWTDALAGAEAPVHWGGVAAGSRRVSSAAIHVERRPDEAFAPIQRIGGDAGWYATNWFWRVRGWLDRIRGGVGLRRGRRDPLNLCVGDQVDFWRVERIEPGRRLLLAAEMNVPGRLWLQFEVSEENGCSTLRQTTVFDPFGLAGLAYWYLLYPVHQRVFRRLLRGIEKRLNENRQPFGPLPLEAGAETRA
ncbi:MAG TPA: DUF2867 domain-containing protein, partial [Solirubrobacteraceae bacterium]|nr:DUF2867 domain-containing protein [Solirubrobacteraceae bacterium]